jgi:hypothetical protein
MYILFPKPITPSLDGDVRPVFITGIPRCGSSWVGEILGSCTGVRYVYEPFNLDWVPELRGGLSHFKYLEANSEPTPSLQLAVDSAFRGLQCGKQLTRAAYRGYWGAATRSASRVVIKDPTACLMTAWIAQQYNAKILIVMRHPCGFASSLAKLDWQVSVNFLLRQENLMREYLGCYEDVMRRATNDKWLNRGAFWAAIHKVLIEQMASHPDWVLSKYENLCSDPNGQFSSLAQKLVLELNGNARSKIQLDSTKTRTSSDAGSTRRESRLMPYIWKQRMTKGEIDAVMGVVAEFGIDDYAV